MSNAIYKFASAVERLTRRIARDEPLSCHTAFGIGGPARLFAQVGDVESLSGFLSLSHSFGFQPLILGGGTNLLVSDSGYDGVVVHFCDDTIVVDVSSGVVRAGAAAPTHRVVGACVEHGLGGLEFASGLPGTVGGAIAGNAGCFGHCLSDRLVGAAVVHPDGLVESIESAQWFDFSYRSSRLLAGGIVLASVVFRLEPGDGDFLLREAQSKMALRRTKHPSPSMKTAGSYFKNLPPDTPGGRRRPAGVLLDAVGGKALSCGDAAVFHKHANIIVNRGHATAAEVLALTEEMSRRVAERFGVILEPEVRFVGPRPDPEEIKKLKISSKKRESLRIDLANGPDGQ